MATDEQKEEVSVRPGCGAPSHPAGSAQTGGASLVPPFSLSQLLRYELGFLVCVAIGLLFAVAVPLAGCCFCCCRCCGRCGGRMSQKRSGRMRSRRRVLYGAVLLVSALLL